MVLHAECFFAPVACMKAVHRLSTPSVGLPQWRERETDTQKWREFNRVRSKEIERDRDKER